MHNFQKAQKTLPLLNVKMLEKKINNFLAQFFMPYHMVWSAR